MKELRDQSAHFAVGFIRHYVANAPAPICLLPAQSGNVNP